MAAATLAAISGFDTAAYELGRSLQWKRASAMLARAFAAARALNTTDCLITVRLQVDCACMMMMEADARHSPGVSRSDAETALDRSATVFLDWALPVLRRRKAAGTLLPPACRPMEVTWFATRLQQHAQVRKERNTWQWTAPLVGYDAYLAAAGSALELAMSISRPSPVSTELVAFAVSGLDLMAESRTHSGKYTLGEIMFFAAFQDDQTFKVAASVCPELPAAWSRLQRSGVLQDRGIARIFKQHAPVAEAQRAAAEARNVAAALPRPEPQAASPGQAAPPEFSILEFLLFLCICCALLWLASCFVTASWAAFRGALRSN